VPPPPLQIREAFHLCFLQEFLRKFDAKLVVLKGGVNLRFFFKSPRYSEDMDLDVKTASVASVKNSVLRTLEVLRKTMRSYGIQDVVPPNLETAKQTETTQRFKVHLMTPDGLDLFTKIEFSRRGVKGTTKFGRVDEDLLRTHRLASVIVQHYDAVSAFDQKIGALAGRSEVQARDIFDLYHLKTFLPPGHRTQLSPRLREKALKSLREISYAQYRDQVVSYLSQEDQTLWSRPELWEDMKSVVSHVLEADS
jgi:predicted nucleotidyltransferase component of viral defense system